MTQTPEDAAGLSRNGAGSGGTRSARVTAAEVMEYLQRHPEFLSQHPDLLDSLKLPGRHDGEGVVDLQQFMVERLRREVQRLRGDQDDLLSNSRDNLATQTRVHRAALALLEARSLTNLVEIVTTDLAVILDVDVVTLCLERSEGFTEPSRMEGVQLLDRGAVDALIGREHEVLLRDEVAGDPLLFGGGAGLVRSDALIRLKFGDGMPQGLMAFGTRHPGYFDSGQGTELLSFLARILEHCVRSWLISTR
ncbi:MAG TPA: DUF484 family protein [Hypericibacter adhaerens]|jgi:uncharacterized protein YigA (DUF484 family)|uniref:DUF484 family protein n=1 Tax=Hypericibacter adhaerens TaxID=2602016 RepID=UPI00124562C1|nr:DUF484 family protein [Hypericibacter adhaerens]HWA43735.1 DUF484 family protein [Hypericibacter adhaerens]